MYNTMRMNDMQAATLATLRTRLAELDGIVSRCDAAVQEREERVECLKAGLKIWAQRLHESQAVLGALMIETGRMSATPPGSPTRGSPTKSQVGSPRGSPRTRFL